MLLAAGSAPAQVPGTDEMAVAFRAAEPQARLAGLTLQPGAAWWSALRVRSPLVAVYSRGACQLGFTAYNPGRDYSWLFPALPPVQRAAWLGGLVQHELAHCAEQAAAEAGRQASADAHGRPGARTAHGVGPEGANALVGDVLVLDPGRVDTSVADALAAGGRGTRWHEVLADLAFALHVDQPRSESGAQLVALMASLRAAHARQDPAHDTSPELQCYLQQRLKAPVDGPWLQRLQAWRQRCWSGPAAR
jgi:hypothetical protein